MKQPRVVFRLSYNPGMIERLRHWWWATWTRYNYCFWCNRHVEGKWRNLGHELKHIALRR